MPMVMVSVSNLVSISNRLNKQKNAVRLDGVFLLVVIRFRFATARQGVNG